MSSPTDPQSQPQPPILIVGAGPTGLTLALELSLLSSSSSQSTPQPYRIISSSTCTPPHQSRGLVLHSRTMELLSRHPGLAEKLAGLGRETRGLRMFVHGERVMEMDGNELGRGDCRWERPIMISQAESEGVLEAELKDRYGVLIEHGVTAVKLEQDSEGVTVWTRKTPHPNSNGEDIEVTNSGEREGPDEEEELEKARYKYVVGCDGARSIVRPSTGLEFTGGTYPQDFILADVPISLSSSSTSALSSSSSPSTAPSPPSKDLCEDESGEEKPWTTQPYVHLLLGSLGFCACLPLNLESGIWRIICSRVGELNSDSEPTLKDFEEILRELRPKSISTSPSSNGGKEEGLKLGEPTWITRFRLHYRIVESYRKERVFLAGDAAHIHSPVGGQGMNAGMQDSINLGWKLSFSLSHPSGDTDEFLNSYNDERRHIGLKLLKGTDRAFEFVASRNWFWLLVRNFFVAWVLPLVLGGGEGSRGLERRKGRFRFVGMLGVRYRNCGGGIVGTSEAWSGKLRGGDRGPDGRLLGLNGETSLLSLVAMRGPWYHLILFSGTGIGTGDAATELDLETAATSILQDNKFKAKLTVHKVLTTGTPKETTYIDEASKIHELYGFKDAGFVLLRPDWYISFIGGLGASSILELKAWMGGVM